jgi:enolase
MAKKKRNLSVLTEAAAEKRLRKMGEAADRIKHALESIGVTEEDLDEALDEARREVYERHYGRSAPRSRVKR